MRTNGKYRAFVLDKINIFTNGPSRCGRINFLVGTVHGTTEMPLSGLNSDLLYWWLQCSSAVSWHRLLLHTVCDMHDVTFGDGFWSEIVVAFFKARWRSNQCRLKALLAVLNLVPHCNKPNSVKIGRCVFRPILAIVLCTVLDFCDDSSLLGCDTRHLVHIYWGFEMLYCLHIQCQSVQSLLDMNMKAPLSFETSSTIYPTTIRDMSEEWIFSNRCENLN
jgi:hypothetical protein